MHYDAAELDPVRLRGVATGASRCRRSGALAANTFQSAEGGLRRRGAAPTLGRMIGAPGHFRAVNFHA